MISGMLAGLLAVAVSLAILVTALTGIGLAARRAFGLTAASIDDAFLAFWVGFGVVTFGLIVWNFWLPIGGTALAAVLAAGGLGCVVCRRDLSLVFDDGEPLRLSAIDIAILAVAMLWVIDQSIAPFASWDGVLYHVQGVRWAREYPVIPGLANLHGPLAFNNSSFLYSAMVDSGPWRERGFHLANGALAVAAVLQATIAGLRWRRGAGLRLSATVFAFVMLAVPLHRSRDIASYATDLPAAVVNMAAMIAIYDFLDQRNRLTARAQAYRLVAVAVLLAAAVSIKLTSGVFAALVVPALLAVWWQAYRDSQEWRLLLVCTAAVIVLLAGVWLARGIVLSGYPFFPLSFAGLPVDWRAPAELADAETAYIALTERAFSWRLIGGNLLRHFAVRDVYAALVPAAVATIAFVALCRRSRRTGEPLARATWLLLPPLAVAAAAWFFSAPSSRYSPQIFWPLAALFAAEAVGSTWTSLSKERRRWIGAALVAIVSSPTIGGPALAAVSRGNSPLAAVVNANLHAPSRLTRMNGEVAVTTFTTRSGATLHVPERRGAEINGLPNACWDAPLPCTPNPSPNLQMRVPGELASGFRVEGGWEMQDYPYYWQSFFLPEWRRRTGASR